MSAPPVIRTIPENELKDAQIFPARPVNIRRDLYQFIQYVQKHGLTRSYRNNSIPKTIARKLAKALSYSEESQAVREKGGGFWSDKISHIARALGLVSFNIEGVYAGYSSTTESYPDNDIKVDEKHWQKYLDRKGREKERAILEALIQMTPSEFFESPMLLPAKVFGNWGSATGPASRMRLPDIRRSLLKLLAGLEPEVWYDTLAFVEYLESERPNLILDRATCRPDYDSVSRLREWEWDVKWAKRAKRKPPPRPEVKLEDIYDNFREFDRKEYDDYSGRKERKITSHTPGAFHRMEGRYFEWFLAEVPYLAGFVDLAFRSSDDPHGMKVVPAYERLRAFRLKPWFFALMGNDNDAQLDRVNVTVLPNFEIVVDALSFPESTLERLDPYAVLAAEDGPVLRLRLDRKRVVEAAAASAPPAAEVLAEIAGNPIPSNVAAELQAWCGHGEKLVFFDDGIGLLEVRGDGGAQVPEQVRPFVIEDAGAEAGSGFAIVRTPEKAFERLERDLHVPLRAKHPETRFAAAGVFGDGKPAATRQRPKPKGEPARKVRLESEDVVGYRCSHRPLLEALHDSLKDEAATCLLPEGSDLLVISAAALPKLRALLRSLSDRFEVETAPRRRKKK